MSWRKKPIEDFIEETITTLEPDQWENHQNKQKNYLELVYKWNKSKRNLEIKREERD